MGAFHRRIGMDALIDHMRSDPATQGLMEKPFDTSCVME